MIQIHLTERERNELKGHRTKRNCNLSERCLYILLSDEGKNVVEIAEITRRNEHTIRFWSGEYKKGGIERLKGISPPGRPSIKGCRIYPVILEIVPESPGKYGYIEAGRTIGMIADYLKREGIEVSAGTIKRVLKKTVGSIKGFPKQSRPMLQLMRKKEKGLMKLLKK